MKISINPNSWTDISQGSCTITSTSTTELIKFQESDKVVGESYLNTPLIILSNTGIKAKSYRRTVEIDVEDL